MRQEKRIKRALSRARKIQMSRKSENAFLATESCSSRYADDKLSLRVNFMLSRIAPEGLLATFLGALLSAPNYASTIFFVLVTFCAVPDENTQKIAPSLFCLRPSSSLRTKCYRASHLANFFFLFFVLPSSPFSRFLFSQQPPRSDCTTRALPKNVFHDASEKSIYYGSEAYLCHYGCRVH